MTVEVPSGHVRHIGYELAESLPYHVDSTQFSSWFPGNRQAVVVVGSLRTGNACADINSSGYDFYFFDLKTKVASSPTTDVHAKVGLANLPARIVFSGAPEAGAPVASEVFGVNQSAGLVWLRPLRPAPSDPQPVVTNTGVHGCGVSADGALLACEHPDPRLLIIHKRVSNSTTFSETGRFYSLRPWAFGWAWSPDSRNLLYFDCWQHRGFPDCGRTECGDSGPCEPRIVPMDPEGIPQAARLVPSLSHDFLVRICSFPEEKARCVYFQCGGAGAHVPGAEGPDEQLFTADSDLGRWSPDSRSVVFSGRGVGASKREIFRVRIDADPLVGESLTPNLPRDARFPTVSPDGKYVAFLALLEKARDEAPIQVFVTDIATKRSCQLTRIAADQLPANPHWSD